MVMYSAYNPPPGTSVTSGGVTRSTSLSGITTIQQPRYIGHTEPGGSAPPSQFYQQIKQPTITRQWAQNAASAYQRLTQNEQARFVVREATKIDKYIKREAQTRIPTLRDIQIAGYRYGKANPEAARLIYGTGDFGASVVRKAIPTKIGEPSAKVVYAFADGAIKGVRNEPIKTLAMFALPGAVGGVLKVASKLPAVGRIVSNPGAMKLASGIIGVAYSKNVYDRVNADVFDGYKDGNVSESSKTLPNGDVEITQTITQIPIMRKPTTNEKAERLGGIWGTELGPMALGSVGLRAVSKVKLKKLNAKPEVKTIKKVTVDGKVKSSKTISTKPVKVVSISKKGVSVKKTTAGKLELAKIKQKEISYNKARNRIKEYQAKVTKAKAKLDKLKGKDEKVFAKRREKIRTRIAKYQKRISKEKIKIVSFKDGKISVKKVTKGEIAKAKAEKIKSIRQISKDRAAKLKAKKIKDDKKRVKVTSIEDGKLVTKTTTGGKLTKAEIKQKLAALKKIRTASVKRVKAAKAKAAKAKAVKDKSIAKKDKIYRKRTVKAQKRYDAQLKKASKGKIKVVTIGKNGISVKKTTKGKLAKTKAARIKQVRTQSRNRVIAQTNRIKRYQLNLNRYKNRVGQAFRQLPAKSRAKFRNSYNQIIVKINSLIVKARSIINLLKNTKQKLEVTDYSQSEISTKMRKIERGLNDLKTRQALADDFVDRSLNNWATRPGTTSKAHDFILNTKMHKPYLEAYIKPKPIKSKPITYADIQAKRGIGKGEAAPTGRGTDKIRSSKLKVQPPLKAVTDKAGEFHIPKGVLGSRPASKPTTFKAIKAKKGTYGGGGQTVETASGTLTLSSKQTLTQTADTIKQAAKVSTAKALEAQKIKRTVTSNLNTVKSNAAKSKVIVKNSYSIGAKTTSGQKARIKQIQSVRQAQKVKVKQYEKVITDAKIKQRTIISTIASLKTFQKQLDNQRIMIGIIEGVATIPANRQRLKTSIKEIVQEKEKIKDLILIFSKIDQMIDIKLRESVRVIEDLAEILVPPPKLIVKQKPIIEKIPKIIPILLKPKKADAKKKKRKSKKRIKEAIVINPVPSLKQFLGM